MSGAGKASRTTPAQDVHERIRLEAEAVRADRLSIFAAPRKYPALLALLESAMQAVESSIPVSVDHEGRRYWVRLRIAAAELHIHDSPGEAVPIVRVMGEGRWAGHRPGH